MRVALLLVGLGTLALMELEAPPRMTNPVNEPPAQATTGLRPSHDTLTKADRLEIPPDDAPPQPLSSNELMHPPEGPVTVAQPPSKIIEQQNANASGKSAIMLPRPRPRQGTSKASAGASPAKPVAEARCPSGAFDGLLKTFNLQTRCQT